MEKRRSYAHKIYQLNTVTYGTVSAPFHAMRCLRELATVYDQQYPLAAKAIRQDFYMDDCITGGKTIDIVMQMQEELLQLLARGNMVLRKWRSNDKRILQNLKIQQNTHDLMIVDKAEACKTLGLAWILSETLCKFKSPYHRNQQSQNEMFYPRFLKCSTRLVL